MSMSAGSLTTGRSQCHVGLLRWARGPGPGSAAADGPTLPASSALGENVNGGLLSFHHGRRPWMDVIDLFFFFCLFSCGHV
jgi:hypothetical protein